MTLSSGKIINKYAKRCKRQEQMNVRDELTRTQLNTIERNLNRLIEHRADIMDVLTLEDFSSKAILTTSLSDAEILELFPQVKESVIEQRTLEAGYRQRLLDFKAGLTDLINRFSDLKDRLESEQAQSQDISDVANEDLEKGEIGMDQETFQELSETQQRQLRFWTGLKDYMADEGALCNIGTPGTSAFHLFGIGRPEFSLIARLLLRPTRRIGIRLRMVGENAEAHFRLLEEQQEEIHNEFGETLEWHPRATPQSCWIALYQADTDPLDENDWPQQYEWLTTKLERFDQVFRSRIRSLNAEDYLPENTDE